MYEFAKEIKKKNSTASPDLKKLRKAIFWDTRIDNIDWISQKEAIIKRVFERGNEQEKKEISRFYGKETINRILKGSEIS